MEYILRLKNISVRDKEEVGAKNAFLGEIFTNPTLHGIRAPDGFSITRAAYKHYIDYNKLDGVHNKLVAQIDIEDLSKLAEIGKACRDLIIGARMPGNLYDQIIRAYHELGSNSDIEVAVRSSSLNTDYSNAGTKDKHDTFLNIKGEADLIASVKKCFASLYSDAALIERGSSMTDQAISVGVQKMIGTNDSCSGFAFTADPLTGFKDVIHISGIRGLKDKNPDEADEFIVYKPILNLGAKSIIQKKHGGISKKISEAGFPKLDSQTQIEDHGKYVLTDEEILTIANWGMILENYYNNQVSVEWIMDSETDEIYFLQAKPLKFIKK